MKRSKNKNKNCLAVAGTATQIICAEVAKIYSWLDENIKTLDADCSACGSCCNFESFGHKLFITTPELLYFFQNVKPIKTQQSPNREEGVYLAPPFMAGLQSRDSNGAVNHKSAPNPSSQSCPYLKNNKCTVRDFRFAACRIFFCKADTEPQNQLSEETIAKFKSICNKFNLPYHYADLRTALNSSEIRKKAMK